MVVCSDVYDLIILALYKFFGYIWSHIYTWDWCRPGTAADQRHSPGTRSARCWWTLDGRCTLQTLHRVLGSRILGREMMAFWSMGHVMLSCSSRRSFHTEYWNGKIHQIPLAFLSYKKKQARWLTTIFLVSEITKYKATPGMINFRNVCK